MITDSKTVFKYPDTPPRWGFLFPMTKQTISRTADILTMAVEITSKGVFSVAVSFSQGFIEVVIFEQDLPGKSDLIFQESYSVNEDYPESCELIENTLQHIIDKGRMPLKILNNDN